MGFLVLAFGPNDCALTSILRRSIGTQVDNEGIIVDGYQKLLALTITVEVTFSHEEMRFFLYQIGLATYII